MSRTCRALHTRTDFSDAEWLVADIELAEGKRLLVNARVRWRRSEPDGVGIQFYSFLERWG